MRGFFCVILAPSPLSSWCAGPPHSCVILGLDPRIQVMEVVAQRPISHLLDRHGRVAPSR